MAVEPIEDLLFRPIRGSIGPLHFVEGCVVVTVPEMYADALICTVTGSVRFLPGHRAVVIRGVSVKASIPAGLQAHMRTVHCLEVQTTDWTIGPQVSGVLIDSFANDIVDIDVEYVPLHRGQSCPPRNRDWQLTVAMSSCEYATAAIGVPFFASTATTSA